MNELATKVYNSFRELYSPDPTMIYSPGRINLIGEHIDYNDGFVMPAAIDKGMYYAFALNDTEIMNFHAIDYNESISVHPAEVKKMNSWKNYVLSVVNEFLIKDFKINGFDCAFAGDVPDGAGMSSSAAVEGGLAYAINEFFGCGFTPVELALLCQRAEHNYPAVNCGIMDQYANMMGKKDHVILLDCRSIEHQYFPLKLDGYQVILFNTKVHHSLASSAYNERRRQCEKGLKILEKGLGITSFRNITSKEELLSFKDEMGEDVYKRCLFVVQEIERTQDAALLLKDNDLAGFGKLMYATHEGLSKLYEVSCKELDFLVEKARAYPGVLGSRMMGGGFGGCTISIVKDETVDDFIKGQKEAYTAEFNIQGEVYSVKTADGTHKIKVP